MSLEDKKVQYIIEAIDESEKGLKESESNLKRMQAATNTLQNASNARIKAAIEGLRRERTEVQQVEKKVDDLTVAHRRNEVAARSSMSQQFNYSRRLSGQFNELATRLLGIGGAYATIRYLSNSLKDAGLNTDQAQKNLESMSATIGTELLPIAEKAMKWFNDNYQVITQTVINFGKTISIVFNGIASLPVGAAAAFYKMRPAIDYWLGIRGEALEKSKREAATLGQSYAESFKAEIDKIGTTIASMSALPDMKTPVKKDTSKQEGPDFGLFARSIGLDVTTYKENEKATKEVQDRIAAYTKEQREALLNDAAEKGEKYKALEAALADSKVSAITDQKERELAETELWYQRELEAYQGVNDSKSMIDEMYAEKKKSIDEAASKRAIDIAEKEKQMKLQNFQMIGGAFNDLMGSIGQLTKENAEAQQGIAIVQAIINTALGVTQAIAQGGVAGIVTGALVAAAGAVQIATIASQNFALGGVARRNPGAVSDSVNINVNPDERIVTKRQQNNLTRFLNNPDGGSRGDTFNIYDTSGDLIETIITRSRNGDDRLRNFLTSRYMLA
ncbi:MAG TPA: hypothetical protein VFM18_08140 [Methanosarcina sp.]|nr:hypothetical protein [Methanosarcina sp.]